MNPEVTCPICGGSLLDQFLNRPRVPVHQNLLIRDQEAAKNSATGSLTLLLCKGCGFIFNNLFDSQKLNYGDEWDACQMYSPYYEEYIDNLVDHLLHERKVRKCRIAEIGCGQGFFLRKLVEAPDSGNVGFGFDPGYVGPETDLDGRLRFEKQFFGPDSCFPAVDIVICRHMIEHVPEPLTLLLAIRRSLSDSPLGMLFLETPSVEWILSKRLFWDFFYEHCCYFATCSLKTAIEEAGFKAGAVRHEFGGQYLWLEASPSNSMQASTRNGTSIEQLVENYRASERRLLERWSKKIRALVAKGGVALWGAGNKGVTLANMVDPGCELIKGLVDINPSKQGCFVPGTGHPIVDYRHLPELGVKTAIAMNPNYRVEIKALLAQSGINITLIT